MNTTKREHAKTFAAEGTVYWLIVNAILLVYLTVAIAIAAGALYLVFTVSVAVVEAVLAYACWAMKSWGFLASTLAAILIAGLAFGILYSPIGDLLLFLQLQVVLFAYRAHREPKEISSQPL
jgi:hypothetical protein